eukprot:915674-Pyramimonas_sp.AAC.2
MQARAPPAFTARAAREGGRLNVAEQAIREGSAGGRRYHFQHTCCCPPATAELQLTCCKETEQ